MRAISVSVAVETILLTNYVAWLSLTVPVPFHAVGVRLVALPVFPSYVSVPEHVVLSLCSVSSSFVRSGSGDKLVGACKKMRTADCLPLYSWHLPTAVTNGFPGFTAPR